MSYGRKPLDISLLDHRNERFLGNAARFNKTRQMVASVQLGNAQLDGARKHLDCFHASRQAISDFRQGQHIGRTGQEKPTGTVVFINRLLSSQ